MTPPDAARRSRGKHQITLGFGEVALDDFVLRRVRLPLHEKSGTHEAVVTLVTGCRGVVETGVPHRALETVTTFGAGQWPALLIHREEVELELVCEQVGTADAFRPRATVTAAFRVTDAVGLAQAGRGSDVIRDSDVANLVQLHVDAAVRSAAEAKETGQLLRSWRASEALAVEVLTDLGRRLQVRGIRCLDPTWVHARWEHEGLGEVDARLEQTKVDLQILAARLQHRLQQARLEGQATVDIEQQLADVKEQLADIEELQRAAATEREARLAGLAEELGRKPDLATPDTLPAEAPPAPAAPLSRPQVAPIVGDDSEFSRHLNEASSLIAQGNQGSAYTEVRKAIESELASLKRECTTGFKPSFFFALGDATGAPATVVQYLLTLTKVTNEGSHYGAALSVYDAMVALTLAAAVGEWLSKGGREKLRGLTAEDKQRIRDRCASKDGRSG